MENISKSLLIAATILIAILIVSTGMYIYNKSTISDVNALDGMSVMAWNDMFLQYGGTQVGTNIKFMLIQVARCNEDYYKNSYTIKYCVCIRSNSNRILKNVTDSEMRNALDGTRWYGVRYPNRIKQIKDWIGNKDKYMISFGYNDETGMINEISINNI